MRRQLVIARHSEDLAWSDRLTVPVVVYNKGEPITTQHELINLPNVGRESHTYLHHIVTRWDQLAEFTVFCQGNPSDHLDGRTIGDFVHSPIDRLAVGRLVHIREWDDAGRLVHMGRWADLYASGEIAPAALTLAEWFKARLRIDLMAKRHLTYTPGALFGAPRAMIRQWPLRFWRKLLADVSGHRHCEEAYYVERAWCYALLPEEERGRL